MSEMSDLFEVMHTMRAMRRLKPDPVPDALIAKILRAGVCAPNGGNTQRGGSWSSRTPGSSRPCRRTTSGPSTRWWDRATSRARRPPA